MPNPLYDRLVGAQQMMPTFPWQSGMQFSNPIQKMNYIMQAMQNPAAFVRQAFPDIPAQIQNDPNQILSYLQQTRGITNQQIQQIAGTIPQNMMRR